MVGGPSKRSGILIVRSDVGFDGGLEFDHTAEDSTANAFGGDFGEETFDLVKPAGIGENKM